MRGQINTLPLIIIVAAIIIGGIAIFVYQETSNINQAVNGVEHTSFIKNLERRVKEYSTKNPGSSEIISFQVPKQLQTVCFVDKTKDIQRFSSPQIDVQIHAQKDKNLFFQPSEFVSTTIDNLEVDQNPLCVNSVNSKINVKLESTGNKTKIIALNEEEIEETKCTTLIYNGKEEEKIDILFLGYGYENNKKLMDDSVIYINDIFKNIEPYKENKDKFNFYQLNKPLTDECELTYYIKCSTYKVKQLASQCPNDYIVILAERNEVLNLASPIRSSAVSNLAKINTADNTLVLGHEFGHVFGNLGDEYVDDTYYGQFDIEAGEIPNCDQAGCASWAGTEGTSCYKGCTLSNFYRPTQNSLMNLYFKTGGDIYGPINEKEIKERLKVYK